MTTKQLMTLVFLTTIVTLTYGQETSLTFTIKEEEDLSTYVGSVSQANLIVPPEERDSLRYSFLTNSQNYFSIQDETGNIFTMVRVNREDICTDFQSNSECEVTFTVAAKTSGTFYQTVEVKVVIEDKNDNSPLFPSLSYELRISEGVTVDTEFSIPSAEDFDFGVYGVQSYEMSPVSKTFQLKYEKNLAGAFDVNIVVKEALNREKVDSYLLTVTAYDNGDPKLNGTMIVNVVVTDINDHKPIFDKDEYVTEVEEGTGRGVTVLTVHASDLDIGDNGRVSYRILDSFPVTDFILNATSGDIIVATDNLEYQVDMKHEFIVEAYDNGEQSKSDQAWVRISVSDTGNNRPEVTVNLLSPGNIGFVNISENSKPGYFVAHVTVKDSDTGLNGEVTCFVQDNYFDIIELTEKGAFKVVVNNPLNREIVDLHTVNVTCTDKGDPPLSSSAAFLVRVTDYNDNRPVFEHANYQAKIDENTKEEQIILQVSATDRDIGKNKDFRYEVRNQNNKIVVNAGTGVISVKPFFDRELTPVVVFEVLAIDKGDIPLTGTATVTLTINDKNDNAPEFRQSIYSFEILENLNSGTTVDQLSAQDLDIGQNGVFTFSLSPKYLNSRLPFTIFSDGIIQTNQALDREERQTYDFDAIVTDQGNPSIESSVKVTIIVKDVNDNKPNITFPSKDNKTVTIYYPNNDLDLVTSIQAYDLDESENGTLKYKIMSGNDMGLFRIEESTGKISIANHGVTIDEDKMITMMIEVRDSGVQSLMSSAELIVKVMFSNATFSTLNEEKNNFVVIVVVVIVITVLLSAIIITVIFLLRNWDKKKKMAESQDEPVNNEFVNKPAIYIMNNTGESSSDYALVNSEVTRKKKEVSFSLDEYDSINNYQHTNLHVNLAPESIKYAPEKPPRQESPDSTKDLYDKVTTRLETLKLQQMLMETRAKQQHHAVPHVNPDDSRSETSGETSSGDSGRGGSEEEIPSTSPSHDDQKMFEYSVPVKKTSYTPLSTHIPSSRANNYSIVPPPIPCRTYKSYSSFNSNNNYPSTHQYLSEPSNHHGDTSVLDPTALSWQHAQPHHHYSNNPIKLNVYAQSDYSYGTPHLPSQYSRQRSQDDDDCSTTTSGSYTLHSIEDLL